MKTNNDSFFAEPVDSRQEARFLTLEVVSRLFIWMAEGSSLEERGVRATVALYCVRPDLISEATLEEIEYSNNRNQELKSWVEEHPEVKTKIEERLRNVPAANRERAFINAAKTEAMNQTVRHNGIRV